MHVKKKKNPRMKKDLITCQSYGGKTGTSFSIFYYARWAKDKVKIPE